MSNAPNGLGACILLWLNVDMSTRRNAEPEKASVSFQLKELWSAGWACTPSVSRNVT